MTSATPDPTEAKRAHFRRLLDDGIATLHLDPRAAGVDVPKHLRSQPMLLLNYSWRYRLADFAFDGDEVIASLSFQGAPYRCVVPWQAVFAVTDPRREGIVWPDDVPADLREQADPAPTQTSFRVVSGGREPSDPPVPASAASSRLHLRRIK